MILTKVENEDALDLLADILEPVATIFSDEKLAKMMRGNGKPIEAVTYAIRNYKKQIIEILARIDGVKPEEYKGTLLTMTRDLMEILKDEEIMSFFSQQGQRTGLTSSGSATGNTEAKGQ